jgi:hypothetical protein
MDGVRGLILQYHQWAPTIPHIHIPIHLSFFSNFSKFLIPSRSMFWSRDTGRCVPSNSFSLPISFKFCFFSYYLPFCFFFFFPVSFSFALFPLSISVAICRCQPSQVDGRQSGDSNPVEGAGHRLNIQAGDHLQSQQPLPRRAAGRKGVQRAAEGDAQGLEKMCLK